MNSSRRRIHRSPRPRAFAAASAAAAAATTVSVAISSHPFSVAEAAFFAPTFATHAWSISSLTARLVDRVNGPVSPPIFKGSAKAMEEVTIRGPLHRCFRQQSVVSTDELLQVDESKIHQFKLTAFLNGDGMPCVPNSKGLGSLSGQYGVVSSPTSLSVSQSTNVFGFRVEDFKPYKSNNDNDNVNDSENGELQYYFEDFVDYQDDSFLKKGTGQQIIRRHNRLAASQTPQRVAGSPRKNNSKTCVGRDPANNTSSRTRFVRLPTKIKANSKSKLIHDEDVPPWFPWLPTQSQIKSLRVVDLRAACAERGLIMTGKKVELQQRLLIWSTVQERKRVKDRLAGLRDLIHRSKNRGVAREEVDGKVYDVDALTNKRKALTKAKKRVGRGENNRGILGLVDEAYFSKNVTDTFEAEDDNEEDEFEETADEDSMVDEASISQLAKTFNAPSSNFSNHEVREMYIEAKAADQAGDRTRSKAILSQLREATPHDMRVVRRLARMQQEEGNLSEAHTVLQEALHSEPDNVYLMHGVGQLERLAGNNYMAKRYFRRAVQQNPEFPNPYHALGTLEHTHGNIRAALSVIKEGIKNCPENHRLYHALGDVYLDANMLDLAEESYLEGLRHAPHWGKSFFYTSLSFVSYAHGHTMDCRTLLRQSLQVNGGMHAQGVIALAQFEESEGNIKQARKVYQKATSGYEKRRRQHSTVCPRMLNNKNDMFDALPLLDAQGNQYRKSYAGDKWINVFRSWARMEEVHGTYETAHVVFSKATKLFSDDVSLLIQWAELHADQGDAERGRLLYETACHRVRGRSAEPYRLFAEFEMKWKNFMKAQAILSRGTQAVAEQDSGGIDSKNDLARLFHTWGVCEYRLGNLSTSEGLFEDALRVTGSKEEDSAMRSLILYSMAKLEFSREEYLLAQHCIGLSLKENLLPGGNSLIWMLWSNIAKRMGNNHLVKRCKEQALLRWDEERGGSASDFSRMLGGRDAGSPAGRLPERTGLAMKDVFRKTPWYSMVCPPSGRMDKNWYSGAKLWEL